MKNSALSALGRRTALPPISWLMHAALTRPKLISLAAGFTDNATLPVEISRKLLNQILRSPKTGQPALQYGITAGETNLRRLTARHLQKLDNVAATPSSQTGRRGVAAIHSARTRDDHRRLAAIALHDPRGALRRRRHRARRRPDVFRFLEHPAKPRHPRARRPAGTRRN